MLDFSSVLLFLRQFGVAKPVVRDLLKKHDHDGNGRVSPDELIDVLAEVGIFCTREDAEYLHKAFDADSESPSARAARSRVDVSVSHLQSTSH